MIKKLYFGLLFGGVASASSLGSIAVSDTAKNISSVPSLGDAPQIHPLLGRSQCDFSWLHVWYELHKYSTPAHRLEFYDRYWKYVLSDDIDYTHGYERLKAALVAQSSLSKTEVDRITFSSEYIVFQDLVPLPLAWSLYATYDNWLKVRIYGITNPDLL